MTTQDRKSPSNFAHACTLIFGKDESLLWTRRRVLECAGFEVLSSMDAAEAERLLEQRKIDLLILCHTVPEEDCEALAEKAHARGMGVKTLMLSADHDACSRDLQDGVVSVYDGPDRLVKAARGMMGGALRMA